MCGINGIIKNSAGSLKQHIHLMNQCIYHRGPDSNGVYIDTSDSYNVAMGMTRLSIIDIQNGDQPMYSNDGLISIVFNGEIYNFNKLKEELKKIGASFKTNSDTEVILRLYEYYGSKSFGKLDGMFAFSIHDKKKDKVYVARDFFGEKPLYYTDIEGFMWASEMKSIVENLDHKPAISTTGLSLYFKLTYIPAPYSIYENINKLEPGKLLVYDLVNHDYKIDDIKYTQSVIWESKITNDFKLSCQTARVLIQESVAQKSFSDAPLGAFLSGGVDSSIVSLCLSQSSSKKIDTFSIGFDKKSFDETDKSRTVSKLIGSNHHEFILKEYDLVDNLHKIIDNFDEPFADASALPTYLVSNLASNHVKVALTGDGGDEVFGGYNKYYINRLNHLISSYIPQPFFKTLKGLSAPFLTTHDDNRGLRFKLNKLLKSVDYDNKPFWQIIALGFGNDSTKLIKNHFSKDVFSYYKKIIEPLNLSSLHEARLIDKHISLEGDMLVKVDRVSMLNSLECRAPFLSKQLWDFSNSLPDHFLIKGSSKKYILKESFKDYFPKGFLEKSKQGFGVPVGDWLRNGLKDELMYYTDYELLNKQNLFNTDYITYLVQNHVSGKKDETFKVWTFFCFQRWYFNIHAS